MNSPTMPCTYIFGAFPSPSVRSREFRIVLLEQMVDLNSIDMSQLVDNKLD